MWEEKIEAVIASLIWTKGLLMVCSEASHTLGDIISSCEPRAAQIPYILLKRHLKTESRFLFLQSAGGIEGKKN